MAKKSKNKNQEGYELILTEKPQAAMKIAYALADNVPEKKTLFGVPYYKLKHKGKDIVVVCAVGHLFSLISYEKGWPVFNVEWAPNYKIRGKSDYTKKYFNTITQLAQNARDFVIATDYDIEGELIGYNILRYIFKQHHAKRMKFSTLTKKDIIEAYENAMSDIDRGLAISGETRHILDWYYGINLSRALMNALSKAGKFKIMSIGRVQGPALNFVVEKEKKIKSFKPKPYWQVYLTVSNTHKLEVKYEKDITKEIELSKFRLLKGKKALARTERKEQHIPPGTPFDLTTLQLEAYRLFGITPSRLLQIAQKLYLAGLISYPRTSSQKLPSTIEYKKILKMLTKYTTLTKYATREKPVEGKKEDAHPAIFPTGEISKLEGDEKRIYDLIVKRFISCFCEDAILEEKKIIVEINGLKFYTQGVVVKDRGWLNVYSSKIQEKRVAELDGNVIIREIRIEEKQTQPPRRYTQASLVAELARKNLGTKATRALIIDTLFQRDYIRGKQIEATPLGIRLIDMLEKEAPIIVEEKLTRHFESEINNIEKAKKKEEKQNKVIEEARKVIEDIAKKLKSNESNIGNELLSAYNKFEEEEKSKNKIMKCPSCNEGWLTIKKSNRGKRFLACDRYPKCKQTYTLPPYGIIKKSEDICKCGFPLLITLRKGRRPWKFCFNPDCNITY